jgi:circadian clock protein KaiC
MLRDFADERELRGALYDLTSRIGHTDTVLLLVGEYTAGELRTGIEFSLADGIVQLDYEALEPVDRRWLRIEKMRGGRHLAGQAHLPDRPERYRGVPADRGTPAA